MLYAILCIILTVSTGISFGLTTSYSSTVEIDAFWGAVITLAVSDSAFTAEIYRAGIQSIAKGQREAAQTIGLSYTQTMRDKLAESVKEFEAILKPNGNVTFLGTPQVENSLYLTLEERGYETRIWTARYPELKNNYGDRLAPFIKERLTNELSKPRDPVDPQRFTSVDLMEREASYGRSGFNLQFQLDTTLSDQDRYPLKISDLVISSINQDYAPEKIIWSNNPEYAIQDLPCVGFNGDRFYRPAQEFGDYIEYTGSVMFIDPSGKGKDATGYACVKMLNGNLYVTDAGGLTGGYSDLFRKSLKLKVIHNRDITINGLIKIARLIN